LSIRRERIGHGGPEASTTRNGRATPSLHSRRRMTSTPSSKRREHRSNKRKRSFSQRSSEVKEVVSKALCSMTGLEKKADEPVEHQVMQLAEAIH
jgi:hypothetical protein